MHRSLARLLIVLPLLLALGACASSAPVPPPPVRIPVAVELPDTPAGRQLAWVIEMINAKRTPSDGDLREHFDDRLMEERSRIDGVRRIFTTIGIIAPIVPTDLERRPGALSARAEGNGGIVEIAVAVERKTGRISDLSFRPLRS